MFDITEYLNSKDVADYWKKIGFNKRCTPQQAAFIIWNSRKATIKEKIEAWEWLIDNTLDCPVASEKQCLNMLLPENLTCSMHIFLKAYSSLLKELIADFYRTEDKTVYTCRICHTGDSDWHHEDKIFGSADECFKCSRDEDVNLICIKKWWISSDRSIELTTKHDGTMMSVDADGLSSEQLNLLHAFEWMWFAFPLPFKRGEIVASHYSPFGWGICGCEPFVLTHLCTWGSTECRQNGIPDKDNAYEHADRRLLQLHEWGDISDMTAHGYFQNANGSVYYECMHHCLDLEYYDVKPYGPRRALIAFSNFIKGKIDGELLALAYHNILQAEQASRQRRELFSSFTKEGLILAGLVAEEPK